MWVSSVANRRSEPERETAMQLTVEGDIIDRVIRTLKWGVLGVTAPPRAVSRFQGIKTTAKVETRSQARLWTTHFLDSVKKSRGEQAKVFSQMGYEAEIESD
jgi:hypothetical protein